jgi:hypothetical protein
LTVPVNPCVPNLLVYKQVICVQSGGTCEPFNPDLNTQKSATGLKLADNSQCPAFCYRITVTNNSEAGIEIRNLQVSDPDLVLSGCNLPATLAAPGLPGSSASCVVSAVTHCQDTRNVVTATGAGVVASDGTMLGNVTARDTNNVVVRPIAIACEVQVSTNGGASYFSPGAVCSQVLLSNSYLIRIQVTNPGQQDLQNVTITSVAGLAECLPAPRNIGTLAVGEVKNVDCSPFTCSTDGRNNYAVSVVGEAGQSPLHVCDFNAQGQRIVAQSTCEACVECVGKPEIEVVKEVACVLPGDTCGTFGKVATGIRDTTCPAFCYQVTVRNVGPVPIASLAVKDPVLGGNISSLFGPLPLAPGDSRTAIIKPIVHCVDTPDTVIAEGSTADGQVATDEDSAEARVLTINIDCSLSLSATNDADGNPNDAHVLLPGSGSVQLTLIVTNTGTAPLRVVAIDGLPALVDCVTGAAVEPTLPATLGPGEWGVFIACTAVSCPAGAEYKLVVHAEADDQNGALCVYDKKGHRIVAETTCPAVVECERGAGCTPGFWKNCTIHWKATPYSTGQKVGSVFILSGCCTDLESSTLRQALDFGGGSGVCGAARNLLRAAVAALLNSSSPEVNYPLAESDVIASVNAALATCNRQTIIELAGELDRANNLGCVDSNGNSLPCKRLTLPVDSR